MEENEIASIRTIEREIKARFTYPNISEESLEYVDFEVRNINVYRSVNVRSDIITIMMNASKEVSEKLSKRTQTIIDEYYDNHEDFFKNRGVLEINERIYQITKTNESKDFKSLIKTSYDCFSNCEPALVNDYVDGENVTKVVFDVRNDLIK